MPQSSEVSGSDLLSALNRKRRLFILLPPILVAIEYPLFHALGATLDQGWRLGWFLGLALYWVTWCTIVPLVLVGRGDLARLLKLHRPNAKLLAILAFPLVMAALFRLGTGMEYEKLGTVATGIVLSSAFGNGFFEELLWRGTSLHLFPRSRFFGIVWPSLWFALWHFAPGSVSPSGNAVALVIGSAFFGFYLSFLSRRTGGVGWCVIAHTLGGLVMVA